METLRQLQEECQRFDEMRSSMALEREASGEAQARLESQLVRALFPFFFHLKVLSGCT